MTRSQTWANEALFNTSRGHCPGLLVLQDGGGVGPLAVTLTLIYRTHNLCD